MDNKKEDAEEVSFNLATYLLLPLIELTENSFGEIEDGVNKGVNDLNFINCYLTEENYIAVEVKTWGEVLLTTINTQHYFTDFKLENGNHMILFRVKGSQLADLVSFRIGAYSQFSQIAKDKIVMFNGFEDDEYIVRVLNGDKRLKQRLANTLEVSVDLIKEAKSAPSESNFIAIENYLQFKQEWIKENE